MKIADRDELLILSAIKFFESHGFKVVHAVQDNFYMLHPTDRTEASTYGTSCFSPRAMQAIGDTLSKF